MQQRRLFRRTIPLAFAIAGLAACGGAQSDSEDAGTTAERSGAPAEQASAHPGKVQFLQCAACHALEADAPKKVGPHLECVIDRQAAAIEDFRYSQSFKDAAADGLAWDRETLLAFIENNKAVVPGNAMSFGGIANLEKREAIVDYLASECSSDGG